MRTHDGVIFSIPDGIEELRVDKAIALETSLSRSVISEMFKQGKVFVNGKTVKRSEKVVSGDEVEAFFVYEEEKLPQGQQIEIEIVFEDEYLAVINKQAGLVVHPGAGNPDGTLVNALLYLYPEINNVGQSLRPGIVHRLDATTSGLLVIAKTQVAYDSFIEKFSTHDVDRRYMALTWGKFETTSGIIDAPLARSARATRMAVKDGGKHARTHYSVEQYFKNKNVTLLDIALETGRTHQIRVHLSAIDHPIVGDKSYGGYRESLECPRPFLHAHTLSFEHPITSEHMIFQAQLPQDLAEVLTSIESGV